MNLCRRMAIGAVLAVAAAAISSRPAVAQTLSGAVRGAGRPVVGATVWLLELDRTERTGARGEFAFAGVPVGTYRLFVAATGYASATDTVRVAAGANTAAFDLVESAIPLEQIVVSASPSARPADEAYQSAIEVARRTSPTARARASPRRSPTSRG